ncbi:MAG TPA: hypothetical protein VGL88_02535 [Pseudonocardiaceae bacterium]
MSVEATHVGRGTHVGGVQFAEGGTTPIGPSREGGEGRAGIMGR